MIDRSLAISGGEEHTKIAFFTLIPLIICGMQRRHGYVAWLWSFPGPRLLRSSSSGPQTNLPKCYAPVCGYVCGLTKKALRIKVNTRAQGKSEWIWKIDAAHTVHCLANIDIVLSLIFAPRFSSPSPMEKVDYMTKTIVEKSLAFTFYTHLLGSFSSTISPAMSIKWWALNNVCIGEYFCVSSSVSIVYVTAKMNEQDFPSGAFVWYFSPFLVSSCRSSPCSVGCFLLSCIVFTQFTSLFSQQPKTRLTTATYIYN